MANETQSNAEKSSVVGNAAAMREACQKMRDLIMLRGDGKVQCVLTWDEFNESQKMLRAALAAPLRNCDVYTADELKVIFNSELILELPIANEHEKNLVTITAMGVIDTLFATTKNGETDGSK